MVPCLDGDGGAETRAEDATPTPGSMSEHAHSTSSTCVRRSDGGGLDRNNFRSAAAVSSLAAATAPAAASSGLSDAGASSTGKWRAMNAAASGLATELEDPANPAQPAPFDPSFNPSLTAKPAGRKYPSAGLTSALEPSDLNRG